MEADRLSKEDDEYHKYRAGPPDGKLMEINWAKEGPSYLSGDFSATVPSHPDSWGEDT